MRVDPDRIEGLTDLDDPPARLFLRGAPPRRPALAVVGTRRADPGAMHFTRQLAARIAAEGVHVVSGGAEGVDAAAHEGALDAGQPTTVVQAASLSDPYPRRHRELFQRVLAAGGGWLSETPEDEPPQPWRFLSRNRLIAALADVVLVVQAPARSGALNTARWARDLARPIFAVPAAPWDLRGAGGARLVREGGARPCTRAEDLAAALGIELTPRARARPRLEGELARVHDALGARPLHVDAICARAKLPVTRVSGLLVRLQLLGLAVASAHGWRVAPGP